MALQVFGTPAPRGKSKAAHFAEAVSGIAGAAANAYEKHTQARLAQSKRKEFARAMKEAYDIDIPADATERESIEIISQGLASQGKQKLYEQKQENVLDFLKNSSIGKALKGQEEPELSPETAGRTPLRYETGEQQPEFDVRPTEEYQPPQKKQQFTMADVPDAEILALSQLDPQLAMQMQRMKDVAVRQKQEEAKAEEKRLEKRKERQFQEKLLTRAQDERIAEPILKEADETIKKMPFLEQALEDIETSAPKVGFLDWLADKTGFEPLRSEEGALFKTGVKDYFLGDIQKVGARPNQWIEQQIQQALPLAGRSPEANLITAAGMRFKIDVQRKRAELIKELALSDRKDKGWIQGLDLEDRMDKLLKPYVELRQKELGERIKEIKSKGKEKNLPKVEKGRVRMISPEGEYLDMLEEDVAEAENDGYKVV